MVSASRPAASQLTASPISVDRADRQHDAEAQRLARASCGRPAAAACAVRCISASMSRSYHMLMAPEAPAPTAMHSTATAASTGWRCARRHQQPGEAGEHHQRHDPRLQQRDVVARPARRRRVGVGADRFRCDGSVATRSSLVLAQRVHPGPLNAAARLDHRQFVEGVERRRRGHRPFQRRGALAPRIGADLLAGGQRVDRR